MLMSTDLLVVSMESKDFQPSRSSDWTRKSLRITMVDAMLRFVFDYCLFFSHVHVPADLGFC